MVDAKELVEKHFDHDEIFVMESQKGLVRRRRMQPEMGGIGE